MACFYAGTRDSTERNNAGTTDTEGLLVTRQPAEERVIAAIATDELFMACVLRLPQLPHHD